MAKPVQYFIDIAKKSAEEVGRAWEYLAPEEQNMLNVLSINTYYKKHPKEAKEILQTGE